MEWSNDLNKYPGLLPEFVHLLDKMQHNLEFPPPRLQSRLLPLAPESTLFYAAFPNYGETLHQALETFHQELRESSVLRDWWQHDNPEGAAKAEYFLQKFYELSQYLGDEIVIAGATKGAEPEGVFIAEVRKPGLKSFLEQTMTEIPATPKPALLILDPEALAITKEAPDHQPVILVRPDLVVGAADIATLRSFIARLSQNRSTELTSTPFGQRIAQAYHGGVTIVGAADLDALLKQVPQTSKEKRIAFERTGFADMKYVLWEHKTIAGRALSQAELSFNGPRHGIASWLAAPRPLGSLDFVSPKTMFAVSISVTSLAQIFDDIQELATASAPASNPNAVAMVAPMAQALGINLKEDLLSLLTGEIAAELDNAASPVPEWKLMLGVKDQSHLQQTLTRLLAASHFQPEQSEQDGTTYYQIQVPSPTRPTEISYAFVDGYLVAGSSHQAVRDAVRLHRGGESLAKLNAFLASLPPGHPSGVSALLYEDPRAMIALSLGQAGQEARESLTPMLQRQMPLVVCAYAEDDAIREATTSTAFDPTTVMMVAAIAIPNLQRAKIAANDSSAVSTLRMVNTAEVTYSATYPQRGFAPNLATLGVDPATPRGVTANHAGLIDATLGNPTCTAITWCVKNGFRFRVTADCRQRMCREFVAVAAPVSSKTGGRNFCSTSEGVIRFQLGPPLMSPLTASQCKTWQPL